MLPQSYIYIYREREGVCICNDICDIKKVGYVRLNFRVNPDNKRWKWGKKGSFKGTECKCSPVGGCGFCKVLS